MAGAPIANGTEGAAEPILEIEGDPASLTLEEERGIEAALESYRQGRVSDGQRAREIISTALKR